VSLEKAQQRAPIANQQSTTFARTVGALERFTDGQIVPVTHVVTDGHADCSRQSPGKRPQDAVVQTKSERRDRDAATTGRSRF
jgi:hypothetical protein